MLHFRAKLTRLEDLAVTANSSHLSILVNTHCLQDQPPLKQGKLPNQARHNHASGTIHALEHQTLNQYGHQTTASNKSKLDRQASTCLKPGHTAITKEAQHPAN